MVEVKKPKLSLLAGGHMPGLPLLGVCDAVTTAFCSTISDMSPMVSRVVVSSVGSICVSIKATYVRFFGGLRSTGPVSQFVL